MATRNQIGAGLTAAMLMGLVGGDPRMSELLGGGRDEPEPEPEPEEISPERAERVAKIRAAAQARREQRNAKRLRQVASELKGQEPLVRGM